MNKYKIVPTKIFKKDLKIAIKRGYNIELLEKVIELIASGEKLPAKYRDHGLSGIYKGARECNITPDWLLIYEIENKEVILYLTRTGTHSDLF